MTSLFTQTILAMDTHIPIQSKPITEQIVSLIPASGEVYLIQHYVIKFGQ